VADPTLAAPAVLRYPNTRLASAKGMSAQGVVVADTTPLNYLPEALKQTAFRADMELLDRFEARMKARTA